MDLIDKILANRNKERKSIYIPEWDATIYVSILTAIEADKLHKKHKDFLSGSMSMEAMVDLLIMKCENAEGDKVFMPEQNPNSKHKDTIKSQLMRESVATITAVAAKILTAVMIPTVEEAEKN